MGSLDKMAPRDHDHTQMADAPTLKSTRDGLSAATAERWALIRGMIEKNDYSRPRASTPPDVGQYQESSRPRSGAIPLRQSQGQRADRSITHPDLSWHTLARNAISVGRAIRFPSDQEAGWYLDDYDDVDRSVDIPGSTGGQ